MTLLDEFDAYLKARAVQFRREGAAFTVGGSLNLRSLTSLPASVSLSAGGSLDLRSLTTLPEGVSLSAGGSLDLRSLTTLPEGVSLSAGGGLNLPSLTSLPAGVSLSAGSWLDLRSLTSEVQVYQGQSIRLRMIDGICTRLISRRQVGEATVWRAQFFRGDPKNNKYCYVAQVGDTSAHGDTVERALRDLRFKLDEQRPVTEAVAAIHRRGTVTFNDYRVITGACESGLREGLQARGIDPDTPELPLAQVLELCRDGYGGETFRKAMGIADSHK
jgi:hypothetical protein